MNYNIQLRNLKIDHLPTKLPKVIYYLNKVYRDTVTNMVNSIERGEESFDWSTVKILKEAREQFMYYMYKTLAISGNVVYAVKLLNLLYHKFSNINRLTNNQMKSSELCEYMSRRCMLSMKSFIDTYGVESCSEMLSSNKDIDSDEDDFFIDSTNVLPCTPLCQNDSTSLIDVVLKYEQNVSIGNILEDSGYIKPLPEFSNSVLRKMCKKDKGLSILLAQLGDFISDMYKTISKSKKSKKLKKSVTVEKRTTRSVVEVLSDAEGELKMLEY